MTTKWNVSAGTYVVGKGQPFNRDYKTEGMAKRIAAGIARDNPDWGIPVVRKMELVPSFLPGFSGMWMEQRQYRWPEAS